MTTSWTRSRVLALGTAVLLAAGACSSSTTPSPAAPTGGTSTPQPSGGSESQAPSGPEPVKGGTIYLLTPAEQWNQVDPQRVYTGEDLALFGGTIYRSLTSFKYSADPNVASELVGDMATDTGTASADAKTWSFTLRDGLTWQDGSEVTCEDVKYGVSRSFALDVINQGPTYQVSYLDIPKDPAGGSAYKGPYSGVGQDLYDKAVECNGKTITFHLNAPIADFNYTVTLGFFAVPKDKDTGAEYGKVAQANGPYKIESYEPGVGGKMILVRNDKWNPDSDPIRKAYPDRWEIDFGVDEKVIDQRMLQSTGNDAHAIMYASLQTENLPSIFADATTPLPDYASRAYSVLDPYSRYYFINVTKVYNTKVRQAMAVALNRAAVLLNIGGDFSGELGDGVIKPNIGQDYAPTGMWTGLLGKPIPDEGDPDYAKQLLSEAGVSNLELCWDYPQTATRDKEAAIIVDSFAKAGIKVTPNPIERGAYYGVVFDPAKACQFGWAGWGPDWPNASTIISPLFTLVGGWDLSQVDDASYNAAVADALATLDRTEQAKKWQDLNTRAMQNAYVIPTTFGRTQRMAGDKVFPVYNWPAYGSWPYAQMFTTP